MARGYPDYEGDKSGLYPKPAWAAKEGQDKSFYGLTFPVVSGDYALVSYPVPLGKVFYVTQISCESCASAVEDRDNINTLTLDLVVGSDAYWTQGGQGGLGIVFGQPIKAVAVEMVKLLTFNYSNHDIDIWQTLVGYEVDA